MKGLRWSKGQVLSEAALPASLMAVISTLAAMGVGSKIAAMGLTEVLGVGQSISLIVISALLFKVWRMHQAALVDELTGLARREREMPKTRKLLEGHKQMVVGILDLDHFKAINDTYGHLMGDVVLRTVARKVRGEIKEQDLAWRHGGEEIALGLVGIGKEDVQGIGDRILGLVRQGTVVMGAKQVKITASLGLAEARAGESLEDVLARADAALYAAKTNGRDCCVVAGAEVPVETLAEPLSEMEQWLAGLLTTDVVTA